MDSEADYEDLDNRIVDLIGQYWTEEKRPLLLSQLGSRDGGEVARRAKSMMGSLRVYLRTRLSSEVNILTHSTKPTVVGAVPANAGITDTDTDHLLDRTLVDPGTTGRRYNAAFWAAFRKPLDPALQRYLHVDQPHHFKDTDDEGRVGPGYAEIERSFIARTGADDATVEESVRGWLESKGMEAEAFYQVGRETTLPQDDLLGRLLTVLDAEDLSRMTIPLDIVQKLRRKAL